ncbi:bifunctional biotin--[acetyl-CoA-carboxylase] synthetase/biotin operon repressor [Stutzerimonas stutzeri TS44]|nr:bifunctional biotin--[acetyl-CoA-carboxylase] synthetase/biotin operon repressor [Stutzerimonas stutzeri TS44]
MSLVAGLAVMVALRDLGVEGVGLKWPNDIYIRGKKLAGVLLELSGDPADICHVVIGIGINVNMISSSEQIDQPWTSLRAELGRLVDRNTVAAHLSETLHTYLHRHADCGFASIRAEWEREHIWQGRDCILSTASQQVHGRVLGINEVGGLRLEVDGVEKSFSSGELSLRLAP